METPISEGRPDLAGQIQPRGYDPWCYPIYVDNNTNCSVDIQFDMFSYTSGGNCDGGTGCSKIDQTGWITIPANTTNWLAVNGAGFAYGAWGIARIADADGTGNEEWDGSCGSSSANPCTCSSVNYSVQLTRTSSGVTAVIQ